MKVWNADTGALLGELRGHTRSVRCVRWSRDGSRLATGSSDQTVRLWDATTGAEIGRPLRHIGPVTSIDWLPLEDHPRLAAASKNGAVRIWNPATGNLTLTLHTPSGAAHSVRWSSDGTRLAASGGDAIYLWDATIGYRSEGSSWTFEVH